jgi:hypothetical protein
MTAPALPVKPSGLFAIPYGIAVCYPPLQSILLWQSGSRPSIKEGSAPISPDMYAKHHEAGVKVFPEPIKTPPAPLPLSLCYNSIVVKKLINNYSTDIPVDRTISEIQQLLVQNGARGIALEYNESGTIKVTFCKIILNNKELPFRLPAKAERVYQALWGEKQEWEHTRYGAGWRQQAEHIAWRICKTWLEAHITLINLGQAKMEEVFLPYFIMPGNKTLFETMEHNKFVLPTGF